MNLSKIVLLTAFFLFANIDLSYCQKSSDGYLVVNIYQTGGRNDNNKLVVTENNKVIESTDFADFNYKNLEKYQLEINNVLDKYKRKNYKLVDMAFGVTHYQSIVVRTYILEKE